VRRNGEERTMSATCGLNTRHDRHTYFYGWPRESGVCDGLPTASLDDLARDLVLRARADVLAQLVDYLNGAADGMGRRTTGDDGRWAVGYLAALGDVLRQVRLLRTGSDRGPNGG